MAHRANFVLVENSQTTIYFSSWGGHITPNILIRGLEFCENYFKDFPKDTYLMDNAWAEGGILIDKDKRHALIFGGEDFDYLPALQRLYIKHVKKIWPNWSVKWCNQGIVDIAEHLGLIEDGILGEETKPEFYDNERWAFSKKSERSQMQVVTILKDGIVSDYKQDLGLDGLGTCILKGEKLIEVIPEFLKIETWHNEIETTNCMLVDYDTKTIFICWGSSTDWRHDEEVRRFWRGWNVQRQKDGLIFHFDYTKRDKSLVEFTELEFESYYKRIKSLE